MDIRSIKTTPFLDQKTGTSGLRKKSSVFKQENYLENFIQSFFDSVSGYEGKTLVIGGDGRYFNEIAIQKIIKMAIANQLGRLLVGKNGIISSPASSYLVRSNKAFGAIILTASHNPGGPNGDVGVKFEPENGATAPDSLMNKVCERTKVIDHYWIADIPDIDLSECTSYQFGACVVEVVDSVSIYADYMQEIFDFPAIKKMFTDGFTICFDALNASSGPYAKKIFEEILGAKSGSVVNATPLPDFGGLHPEPNRNYAKALTDLAYSDNAPDLCCASDGDADRYLIMGKKFYVGPSDALAIFAKYLDIIPFYKGRMYGVARSMPTTWAVDMVAAQKGFPVYETPTGWKFFGSLLDAQRISLCGEESFGAASFHIREKDGIWAVLLWLNILAYAEKTTEEIVTEMWKENGRVYTTLHNYDELDLTLANQLLQDLIAKLPDLVGKSFGNYTVESTENFIYTDPITQDVSALPCPVIRFTNKSKIILRLSGTSTAGATLRIFLMQQINDLDKLNLPEQEMLAELADVARQISEVTLRTGRNTPSVIL